MVLPRDNMAVTGEQVVPYEQQLDRDKGWALMEGSLHFEGSSKVQKTLRRITEKLSELGIPHAVAGGMALYQHGFRRFTEDIDIIVTRNDLQRIHAELDGRGYVTPFEGSKNLREAESGVRIEFIVTGGYPGDGKPKPVAFPDPREVAVDVDGIPCVRLPNLIDLKLASGMTGHGRRRDIGDVEQLIETLNLSRELAEQLNPYVRKIYLELWDELHTPNPGDPHAD